MPSAPVPRPWEDPFAGEDHRVSGSGGVLRSILALRRSSGKQFGSPERQPPMINHPGSRSSSSKKKKKRKTKKRRDCLGRILPCPDDDAPTVDEFDCEEGSATEHLQQQHRPPLQFHSLQPQDTVSLLDQTITNTNSPYYYYADPHPTYVDIFYDSQDRYVVEADMDEDRIPIGLEPDDHVMLESFELLFRPDGPAAVNGTTSVGDHPASSASPAGVAVPLECDEGSLSASCSSLSASERPCRAVVVHQQHSPQQPPPTKPQVTTNADGLPLRFLRACKGNAVEGQKRYQETLQWRKDNNTDHYLFDAWPSFELVKQHYPHYFHSTGRKGQPVFYEQPPKTDLKALRNGGVGLEQLLKHYTMITEFQWQVVERNDLQRSIYIIDLAGIRMSDFVGDCVDFVRTASAFTSAHYPERAGHVFVVHVPGWFRMIWNVIKPMVDEVTLEKIHILRGKEEIFEALLEQIPVENIPQEYGGQSSYKLGESPEEVLLRDWMKHNNEMAQNNKICHHLQAGDCCRFCDFTLARKY